MFSAFVISDFVFFLLLLLFILNGFFYFPKFLTHPLYIYIHQVLIADLKRSMIRSFVTLSVAFTGCSHFRTIERTVLYMIYMITGRVVYEVRVGEKGSFIRGRVHLKFVSFSLFKFEIQILTW